LKSSGGGVWWFDAVGCDDCDPFFPARVESLFLTDVEEYVERRRALAMDGSLLEGERAYRLVRPERVSAKWAPFMAPPKADDAARGVDDIIGRKLAILKRK
jgi:hypothetical protein